MTRQELFRQICSLAQPIATVVETGTGWPGIVNVQVPGGDVIRVALHVSVVTGHSRRDYEKRFQNPGDSRPVIGIHDGISILLGIEWFNERAVFVATDGKSRIDRSRRFSILFNNNVLRQAYSAGWAMYQSTVGERIYAFVPVLLPIYVEMVRDGLASAFSDVESRSIQLAISAAGIDEDTTGTAPERARRAASVLIRDYAFGGAVVRAYNNICSMCGIDTGLVVGAHIMPVEASNAPDRIWNGLALCYNHHAAFDQHKIWVDPATRVVRYRPDIVHQSQDQTALRIFVENTFEELVEPVQASDQPREEMFHERYGFYRGQYDWVGESQYPS